MVIYMLMGTTNCHDRGQKRRFHLFQRPIDILIDRPLKISPYRLVIKKTIGSPQIHLFIRIHIHIRIQRTTNSRQQHVTGTCIEFPEHILRTPPPKLPPHHPIPMTIHQTSLTTKGFPEGSICREW